MIKNNIEISKSKFEAIEVVDKKNNTRHIIVGVDLAKAKYDVMFNSPAGASSTSLRALAKAFSSTS